MRQVRVKWRASAPISLLLARVRPVRARMTALEKKPVLRVAVKILAVVRIAKNTSIVPKETTAFPMAKRKRVRHVRRLVPPTWIVRVVEKSVKMAAAVCLLVPKMMIAQAAMESHAAKSKLASALRA